MEAYEEFIKTCGKYLEECFLMIKDKAERKERLNAYEVSLVHYFTKWYNEKRKQWK